jgi:23S rRNA (pseudouridine1915-N3)-methyltransferase
MKLRLLAVGQKMPSWVEQGYKEYAKRLPSDCNLELVELASGHRGKSTSVAKVKQQEGEMLLKAIKPQEWVVALDVKGKPWSTEQLSEQLAGWRMDGKDICLLIGGPDGMSDEVMARANQRWSLSNLTLPHPLFRIVMAEQGYRAWTILQNNPYHK